MTRLGNPGIHDLLPVLPENPKLIQAEKDGKDPLEYLVTSVWPEDAEVHKHGALKYGLRNWRVDRIRASTYVGAILRHLRAWAEGEDLDPDSGVSHLAHIRACCAVVRDAQMHGTFIDDRNVAESKDNNNDYKEERARAQAPSCGYLDAGPRV